MQLKFLPYHDLKFPSVVKSYTDRYSMAYFHSSNVTRPIKAMPSCIDNEHLTKYDRKVYVDLIRDVLWTWTYRIFWRCLT